MKQGWVLKFYCWILSLWVPESDGRLVVQAIRKWNICEKQIRREQDDNLVIYGDNGRYTPRKKIGGILLSLRVNPKDKHHPYVFEAELQMHQVRIPLCAKPQVFPCFRSGLSENGNLSFRSGSGSLDSVTDSGASVVELNIGIKEIGLNVPWMPIETKEFVNNSYSPKSKTESEESF
ncbi:hypothetical protein Ddye_027264 [Dipteronia dyeriana]|uniref:BCAS3 domain-containing protein n=1 Tax=Dipteronia dyeriana TaxID=168575 RepID=A0AAD9TPP3_9ROSI|nr:hypothetical protein Ddye_027264 [Dipteronia dyeriana]